jgi:hypothetical protein
MKHIALIIALLIATLTPGFGRGRASSGFSGRHSYRAYRTKSYGPRSSYSHRRTPRTRTYSHATRSRAG